MWRTFIGSFFGKIAAAIFVSACLALGFGPDRWAAMILAVNPVWYVRAILVLSALGTAAIILAPWLKLKIKPQKPTATKRDTITRDDIPDVRIADDPAARHLFETSERDKPIPLLEAGKIESWGRRGNGSPPLMRIPADQWRTHFVEFHPARDVGINQTFLKIKGRPYETTDYYDIHLNREQLKRVWRDELELIPLLEAARLVFDQTKDSTSAQLARAEGTNDLALRWYCYQLIGVKGDGVTRLLEMTGTRPPCRVQEPIQFDRPPPDLEIRGGAAVLVDRYTNKVVADNLMVPSARIPFAVSFIVGLDGNVRGIPPNTVVNAS
jgi:hypothetical protein